MKVAENSATQRPDAVAHGVSVISRNHPDQAATQAGRDLADVMRPHGNETRPTGVCRASQPRPSRGEIEPRVIEAVTEPQPAATPGDAGAGHRTSVDGLPMRRDRRGHRLVMPLVVMMVVRVMVPGVMHARPSAGGTCNQAKHHHCEKHSHGQSCGLNVS
jgi:hypothetical protein